MVGMYKVNGDVRTVCGYETGLDMTTVNLCPSTRTNRKDSEGTRTSPVRPNNQPAKYTIIWPVDVILPPCTSDACTSHVVHVLVAMDLGLLDLRALIHVPQALCVRFYYCAGANPLLSICAALL